MTRSTDVGAPITTPSFEGHVGVARCDVTPPVGIRGSGWGPADWTATEGIHRPLTLTALAIRAAGDDTPVLILSVDGLCFQRVDDEWRVRGEVLARLGLPPERLLISMSHTHAGPSLVSTDTDDESGRLVSGYLDSLAEAAVQAGHEAVSSAVTARFEWASGRCGLAANRDLVLGGRALTGFNPEGAADDTLLVGRVSTTSGTTMATLVNYACHPTTLAWQNRLISPDYVGALREAVETDTKAPCVFLQGASGDLAPREQYTGDVSVADRHGHGLGHAVLAVLSSMPPAGTSLALTDVVESGAPLAVWQPTAVSGDRTLAVRQVDVEMELQSLPSLDELEVQWSDIGELSRKERMRRVRNLRDDYVLGPTVVHPVWAWRLGGALVVAHPGEAYSRFQQTVREHFPGHPVVVMNLTNGPGFVYVPSREAYEIGAYPSWQSPLAAGSLERLEAHAVDALEVLCR